MKEKLEQIRVDFQKLQNVLDEAKNDVDTDRGLFLKSKIFKMGRFIRLYHELMKDLEVDLDTDTVEALEDLDPTRDMIKDLATLKIDWDQFLKSLEDNVC